MSFLSIALLVPYFENELKIMINNCRLYWHSFSQIQKHDFKAIQNNQVMVSNFIFLKPQHEYLFLLATQEALHLEWLHSIFAKTTGMVSTSRTIYGLQALTQKAR